MRRFLPVLLILVIVLLIYPFIGVDDSGKTRITGLPWQIELLEDGTTRVFGITPGKSTLADAVDSLGVDHELGIVTSEDSRNLEMYFGHYRAGLMSAKIVLGAAASEQDLDGWMQRSVDFDHMRTGKAKKHFLNKTDLEQAMASVIRVITFIPAVNLDDEIIRQRFGEPSQVVQHATGSAHYLYPEKGLDLVLNAEGKEVLQYIAPQDFASLLLPLELPAGE